MYLAGTTLYYSPECPHCRKVLDWMAENEIFVETEKNVDEPEIAEEMMRETGATGWTTLVTGTGEVITGSSSIIKWMEMQE